MMGFFLLNNKGVLLGCGRMRGFAFYTSQVVSGTYSSWKEPLSHGSRGVLTDEQRAIPILCDTLLDEALTSRNVMLYQRY